MPGKIHIAFVMRLFSSQGGLELYALKLIEGLLERQYKITVICERDESAMSHPLLTVKTFAGPDKKWPKWRKMEHYYKQASAAVKEAGPFDLVHSQHFPVAKPDVVTFHNHTATRLSKVGYPFERLLNNFKLNLVKAYKLRYSYDRELCLNAGMRIFVAQVMKDDYYNTYELADRPFAIAPPGASLQVDSPKAPPSELRQEKFTFLFVGKGFSKKGLDTLFNAMALLKKRKLNCRLLIAGLAAKPIFKLRLILGGISDQIEFLGYQKDMAAVYKQAQVQVLPSKMEPFGMAPVQGMQYGLVPIVSQVCGVAEVLQDQEDALILRNHLDAQELADLMARIAEDRVLYEKLSANALVKAAQVNWNKTVAATEAAYEKLLVTK